MSGRTTRTALLALLALVAALVVVPAGVASAALYAVTLTTARAVVPYGDDVAFTATVTTGGAPAADTSVALYGSGADGVPELAWAGRTDSAGNVTLTDYDVERSATYVARAGADQSASNAVPLGVSFAIGAPVSNRLPAPTLVAPVAVPPGGQVVVHGTVAPAGSTSPVTVEQRFGSGPWTAVGSVPVAADGTFAVPLGRTARVGTWTVRVTHQAEGGLVAGAAEASTRVRVSGVGPRAAWRPVAGSRRSPARWGTCRIDYRVNPRRMPATGPGDLREAMRRVTQVSGIRFRYRGRSTVTPYSGYRGPGRNRIVVAWAPPEKSGGLLANGIGGVGGTSRSGTRLLSGFVLMNSDYSSTADPGFAQGMPLGLVLMHELGHVVGLDHATDDRQIMAPGAPLPAAVWGAADIAGLHKVGSRCR